MPPAASVDSLRSRRFASTSGLPADTKLQVQFHAVLSLVPGQPNGARL
jgi:hypothetical protein